MAPAFVSELGLANLNGKGAIPYEYQSTKKFLLLVKLADRTSSTGEHLEFSLQKNLDSLQLASISLLRPLHSLPQGSGISAFLRRTDTPLMHLNSSLTRLSSGINISICPSSSLTFFSEASASWLHSKYCFDQQRDNPFLAKWDPKLESVGKFYVP